LNQDFNLSISDIENMMPWEKEVFIMQIISKLEKQKNEQQ